MSGSNPLNSRYKPGATPQHPAQMHAEVWQHVNKLDPSSFAAQSKQMDDMLPVIGALAGNPNVNSKDVIKAAANAAAEGKVSPSEAVQFISSMPSEPDKLQGWLKNRYAVGLSVQVHMKAAMMRSGGISPVPAQQPPTGGAPAPGDQSLSPMPQVTP
jgi:hypothetical protein